MDHTCKLPVWTGGVKFLHGKTVDVNVIDLLQKKKRPQSLLNKQLYAIQSILQDSQLSENRINPSLCTAF